MSGKLHSKQIKAARLVAWGRSSVEISKLLGVCPDTLYRWKKNPEFAMACEAVIQEQYDEMCYRLRDIALSSVQTVWSQLQNTSNESQRLMVAMNMLKLMGVDRVMAVNHSQNTPRKILKVEEKVRHEETTRCDPTPAS